MSLVRRLFGSIFNRITNKTTTPIVRHKPSASLAASENYEGMHKYYRWFRQDEMVRRCLVVNAYFATLTAGFETELEAVGDLSDAEKERVVEKYGYVKEFVDEINKQVNLDSILFVSQIKRSIYGNAAWEIVTEKDGKTPAWLLSLESERIKPEIDEDTWELLSYKINNVPAYEPEKVLYFTNMQLESDKVGLSDIEPVVDVLQCRHYLLREDFKHIVKRFWAPYVLLEADTAGFKTKADKEQFVEDLSAKAKSGESLAFNASVKAQVVDFNINFGGLVQLMDKLEETVMRQFGTPRMLVGKAPENRATAYAELEAFVGGIITSIQRYFKRELERQWYDRLTALVLAKHKENVKEPPVLVKHVWKPVRTADVYQMASAVTALYGQGLGILAGREDIAAAMMGWDKERFKEEEQKRLEELKEKLEDESETE